MIYVRGLRPEDPLAVCGVGSGPNSLLAGASWQSAARGQGGVSDEPTRERRRSTYPGLGTGLGVGPGTDLDAGPDAGPVQSSDDGQK